MIVKCGIQVNVHPDDEKTKRNIYMVKHFLTRTAPGIAAAAIFVALPLSCVNEEYDLEKIDTTVQFGGNALVFPLGSTEQLKLQTLLPENEYLQLLDLANGQVWGFRMSDEMDMSDEIPDLKGYLDIDDISINSDIDETLEIDLSNADIEETVFPDPDDPDADDASISFEGMEMPDIDELLPGPGQIQPVDIEIGIADYYPDEEQLGMNLPEASQSFHNVVTQEVWNGVKNAVEASGVTGDVPISIGKVLPASIELPQGRETKVSVKIELPEGISNVRDVVFAEGAKMHISLSLVNSFLAEGEVTPEISVAGLGDLVMIDDQSFDSQNGTLDLSGLTLSAENPVAERDYVLTGLPDMEWNGNKLDAEVSVDASGKIRFSNDVSTTAKLIAAQSEMLGIDIDISFTGTMIADMTMDVEPLVSNVNPDMDIAIGEIKLPSEVKSVERVDMNDNSGITMKISSENLSQISGLEAVLTNLQIKFPEALGFGTYPAGQQGTFDEASRTLTVENADLTEDMEIFMPVEAILPPEPETSPEGDRIIAFDGKVIVEASYSAGGKGISLSELPTEGGVPVNAGIVIDVVPDLSVKDYSLTLNEIEPHVVDISQDISMTFGEEVGDLGKIKVTPHVKKQITMSIDAPEFDNISIEGRNLKIAFPEMLVFEQNGLDRYGYDPEDNSLNFNGTLPTEPVVLDIDYILIDPVPVSGSDPLEYTAGGPLTVTGSVSVVTEEFVHKPDVDKLIADGISISGRVPALELKDCDVSIEEFKYAVDQTQTITLFDPASLQESINDPDNEALKGLESLEINTVNLSDANFALNINIKSLPEGLEDADLVLDLYVTLPKEIIVEENPDYPGLVEETENGKVLHLNEQFENGTISIDYVRIAGLDMAGTGNLVDLEGPLERDVVVSGTITAGNATITSPEQLDGGKVEVSIDGGIKDITVGKVTGYIDYTLGADGDLSQSISLADLPDFMKGEDFTLDFENPYIEMTVTSNVGIPVEGEIEIVPVFGDAPDEEAAQTISISIPAAESAGMTKTYWIAATQDGMPSGYEFLEANIASLLKRIPDSISLNINAHTDAEQPSTIETSAEYELTLGYDVVVPFVFGEDLKIKMDYTIPGESDDSGESTGESPEESSNALPPVLGELLNMNALGLGGYIESALPLQLELTMDLLDSHDEIIRTEPIKVNIAAGSAEKPVQSPLDVVLKLSEGADGTDLTKIRMNFEVTSGNMSGEPVTDMSYIQAVLKVKVPGGITIDLSSLGESENNTENTDYEN